MCPSPGMYCINRGLYQSFKCVMVLECCQSFTGHCSAVVLCHVTPLQTRMPRVKCDAMQSRSLNHAMLTFTAVASRRDSAVHGCPGSRSPPPRKLTVRSSQTWMPPREAWSSLQPTPTPPAWSLAGGSQSECAGLTKASWLLSSCQNAPLASSSN